MDKTLNGKPTAIGETVTNGAEFDIKHSEPYTATITIVGVAPLLLHRWNTEAVAEKAAAAKGSKAKKSDNLESYVYRTEDGYLAIPGTYLVNALVDTAKYLQDPRSPRKSAKDLFKAGVIPLSDLCSLGKKDWDYEDHRRVVVQRNAITRVRPAFRIGWTITCQMLVNVPEYISPATLHEVATKAGKLNGLADFRPTYGRFRVTKFEIGLDE